MGEHTHHTGSGRDPLEGALRGAFRSVLLGWTDPVSGERLTVRMRGERGLIDSLGSHGFEVLDGRGLAGEGPVAGRLWRLPQRRDRPERRVRSLLAPEPYGSDGTAAAG